MTPTPSKEVKPDPKKEVAPAPTHGNREFPRQADAVKAGPTISIHDRYVQDNGKEPVDPSTFNVKGFAQRDMASQQPVDQPRDLNEKKA